MRFSLAMDSAEPLGARRSKGICYGQVQGPYHCGWRVFRPRPRRRRRGLAAAAARSRAAAAGADGVQRLVSARRRRASASTPTTPNLANSPNPLAGRGRYYAGAPTTAFNNSTISASGIIRPRRRLPVQQLVPRRRDRRISRRLELPVALSAQRRRRTPTRARPQYADFYRANMSSWVGYGQRLCRSGHVVRHHALRRRRRRLGHNKLSGMTDTGRTSLSGGVQSGPSGGYFGDGWQEELRLGADGRPRASTSPRT